MVKKVGFNSQNKTYLIVVLLALNDLLRGWTVLLGLQLRLQRGVGVRRDILL